MWYTSWGALLIEGNGEMCSGFERIFERSNEAVLPPSKVRASDRVSVVRLVIPFRCAYVSLGCACIPPVSYSTALCLGLWSKKIILECGHISGGRRRCVYASRMRASLKFVRKRSPDKSSRI